MPYEIEPQVAGKNYCVLGIIYFLRNYYGLPKMSQEDIAKDYINKLKPTVNGTSVDVENQGMLTSDIIPYIELYFATFTGGISYSDIIKNHYLMLATLQPANGSTGHAILVIGIDGNDVVYYDPLDGRQKKIDISYVSGSYVIVKGAKK